MGDLHEGAKANFDEKGKALFGIITENKEAQKSRSGEYVPDVYISENFGPQNIIGEIECSSRSADGTIAARWFNYCGKQVGLAKENYTVLRKLAENIQKNEIYRDRVSREFVEDVIFDWVKINYQREVTVDLTNYLKERCQEAIKTHEIWIPISGLHLESDLAIGKVLIRTMTRAMLDEWVAGARQFVPSKLTQAQFEEYSKRERKNIQGFAALVAKVSAEPKRASEIAYELADETLSILRALSPYNISPERICYCAPIGRQNEQTYQYYHVCCEKILRKNTGTLDKAYQAWFLHMQEIQRLRESGLDILGKVLKLEEKSNFQRAVLNSLSMYSKSCLMRELSDKLVYILVALESLLLKNENEPIQQNIAERMAFVVGQTVEERKAVVKLVKEIYGLRSRFIHHGNSIDDVEALRKFMFQAFMFFINISLNINNFSTKELFIESLEEMKLS